MMRTALLAMVPLLAPAANDGDILKREPCPGTHQAACETLTYSSASLPVIAYYYAPQGANLPVVVFNRGSYVVQNQLPALSPIFERLAQAGFATVAPMYRGSEGAPGRDEMGGADLDDLKNVIPLIRQLPALDSRRLFLYGESRGGIMTFLALRDGFPARAAATFGGLTDLGAYLDADPRARKIATAIWPDFDTRRAEIVSSRSVLHWPERLNTPLLLMHGGADQQVSPSHSLNLAHKLVELKKSFSLVIFAGGNHTLSKYAQERDRQAIEWFRSHLK